MALSTYFIIVKNCSTGGIVYTVPMEPAIFLSMASTLRNYLHEKFTYSFSIATAYIPLQNLYDNMVL